MTTFYYDEDYRCLVKVVDGIESTRMSLDLSELYQLEYTLSTLLNEVSGLLQNH